MTEANKRVTTPRPRTSQTTDPVFAAIEAHRAAASSCEAAEAAHLEALSQVRKAAAGLVGEQVDEWWHFAPSPLAFFSECRRPGGPRVDVSDLPAPHGTKLCWSNGAWSHEDIDALGDAGILYRGERERLHVALAGNLRRKAEIDRLGAAFDEAQAVEQSARYALADMMPTTAAGEDAQADYLSRLVPGFRP
jgi:hypothetical protein